ncbi:MAG: SDR family oxidoreductase [Dehalococcoidia bacterium]|nr:SDR family oxidoreductase [Dehalococcoidia bacterium]
MAGMFEGKVALVTGASSGIGRAAAIAFAREGAKVVVSDVDASGGEDTVHMITDAGGDAYFVRADVSQPDQVENLISETVRKYGRLDFAFNNAGIEGEQAATADSSEANWDRVLSVNLKGAWLCMKNEIPQMLKQGKGAIVNMSSVAGLIGYRNIPAYVASKHGVIGLTKTAALEYATTGIRINVVCPGVIRTPMVERFAGGSPQGEAQLMEAEPIGRLGVPEEVAEAVIWLCSDAASFVLGHAMVIDGGLVAQ